MPRYYIAVPKLIKEPSYQTILTWKNYSFTGTYDEALIKAIILFRNEGYFGEQGVDFYDKYEAFWGGAVSVIQIGGLMDAWANKNYEFVLKCCKYYFKEYFKFESDDVNKGIIEWDKIDPEYMKNYDEDEVNVTVLHDYSLLEWADWC